MTGITTVIFDMYETLVEKGPHLWQGTFQEIIDDQGLPIAVDRLWREWRAVEIKFRDRRILPEAPFESYHQGWADCFDQAFRSLDLHGDPEKASSKSILDMSRRSPYTETIDALRAVQRHWRTAILSNADDGYLLPNAAALDLKFEEVMSSEEGRSYKPGPSLFYQMLRKLDVTPGQTAYVGDRQFEDVLGASRVGMRTVWINRSGAPPDPALPTPDYQISSLLELPGILTEETADHDQRT